MANPVHQSVGAVLFQAAGVTAVLAAPAGIVDGELLIAHFDFSNGGSVPSLAGWTAETAYTNIENGRQSVRLWKRASGESGNYTFTVPNVPVSGFITRTSGAKATGSPFSGTGNTGSMQATGYTNDANTTNNAAGALTPLDNESLICAWWIGLDATAADYLPVSLIERVNAKDSVTTFLSQHLATFAQATAAAVDVNCTLNGGFRTAHVYAIAPASGGGGGAATQLAFSTQPGNTVVGATMANVVVQARDAGGSVDASYTANVVIALQTGSGTLLGTLTRAAVAGVATFNDLSNNTLNTGAALRATSGGLTLADSASFNFTVGGGAGAGGSPIGSALIS